MPFCPIINIMLNRIRKTEVEFHIYIYIVVPHLIYCDYVLVCLLCSCVLSLMGTSWMYDYLINLLLFMPMLCIKLILRRVP